MKYTSPEADARVWRPGHGLLESGSIVAAVRGRLRFGDTELEARDVRWRLIGRKRISFHRRLGRYNEMTGQLTLDDGTVIPVELAGPFLRPLDTAQES
jgi:hypothetical protein